MMVRPGCVRGPSSVRVPVRNVLGTASINDAGTRSSNGLRLGAKLWNLRLDVLCKQLYQLRLLCVGGVFDLVRDEDRPQPGHGGL